MLLTCPPEANGLGQVAPPVCPISRPRQAAGTSVHPGSPLGQGLPRHFVGMETEAQRG